MAEAQVVDIKAGERTKKAIKPRLEPIQPTQVVEIWRLVRESIFHGNQVYPDNTEENPDLIQSHLFEYMKQPNFAGLLARIGKKPAGIVLGNIVRRPYGRPSVFCFVWCLWVDPSARKQGVGQALWKQYAENLRRAHIFHWEAQVGSALEKELVRDAGIPVRPLFSVVGGRI